MGLIYKTKTDLMDEVGFIFFRYRSVLVAKLMVCQC